MENPAPDPAIERLLNSVARDAHLTEGAESLDAYLTEFNRVYLPVYLKHGYTQETALLHYQGNMVEVTLDRVVYLLSEDDD